MAESPWIDPTPNQGFGATPTDGGNPPPPPPPNAAAVTIVRRSGARFGWEVAAGVVTLCMFMGAAALSLVASLIDSRPEIAYPQDPWLAITAVSIPALICLVIHHARHRADRKNHRRVVAAIVATAIVTAFGVAAMALGFLAPVRPVTLMASSDCGPLIVVVGTTGPRNIIVQSDGCQIKGACGVSVGIDGAFGFWYGYRGHVNLDGTVDGVLQVGGRLHEFHAVPLASGAKPPIAFADYGCSR